MTVLSVDMVVSKDLITVLSRSHNMVIPSGCHSPAMSTLVSAHTARDGTGGRTYTIVGQRATQPDK